MEDERLLRLNLLFHFVTHSVFHSVPKKEIYMIRIKKQNTLYD